MEQGVTKEFFGYSIQDNITSKIPFPFDSRVNPNSLFIEGTNFSISITLHIELKLGSIRLKSRV